MIEHLAIIQMMQQLGFSEKWINWTTSILSTTLICATSTTNSLKYDRAGFSIIQYADDTIISMQASQRVGSSASKLF
jgi:hypothetical protein